MRRFLALPLLLLFIGATGCKTTLYTAEDEFAEKASWPADEGPHHNNSLEWWYMTGHLHERGGEQRTFGVEYVYFHFTAKGKLERKLMHVAISDPQTGTLHYDGELENWDEPEGVPLTLSLDDTKDGVFYWRGTSGDYQLMASSIDEQATGFELTTASKRGPVFHGGGTGYQQYGQSFTAGYVSYPHLQTTGRLWVDGDTVAVSGELWMDRQWNCGEGVTNSISWDWMALQFEQPKVELMLYMVHDDETGLAVQGGTFSQGLGGSRQITLAEDDVEMTPTRYWRSPKTKKYYPVAWRVFLPEQDMELQVEAAFDEQELFFKSLPGLGFSYWEGMVYAKGSWQGVEVAAEGYLEMTNKSKKEPEAANSP